MIEVIVPWRGGCEHRERAWAYVAQRYAERHAGWSVIRVEPPPGEWCKALAVNPAVERSKAEVIVLADADCWTDGLADAVEAVKDGEPWAMPHTFVHRLTEAGSQAVYRGEAWTEQPLTQPPYRGVIGGGFVVASKEVFTAVPMDPRFVGWGGEDLAFALALQTLAGPQWRGQAPLLHLWHPPQERLTRKWGSIEGRALVRRYQRARNHPDQMGVLIREPSSPH